MPKIQEDTLLPDINELHASIGPIDRILYYITASDVHNQIGSSTPYPATIWRRHKQCAPAYALPIERATRGRVLAEEILLWNAGVSNTYREMEKRRGRLIKAAGVDAVESLTV